MTTYRIDTTDGRRLDGTTYPTEQEAAQAIADVYGWDDVILSDSYTVMDGRDADDVEIETSAVSAYETQDACDADQDGSHAPRIVTIEGPARD